MLPLGVPRSSEHWVAIQDENQLQEWEKNLDARMQQVLNVHMQAQNLEKRPLLQLQPKACHLRTLEKPVVAHELPSFDHQILPVHPE